ncbi:hypothetical protein PR202_ga24486 [Eleusine coracana subsp. coracana]|uniref:Pentatricopeptide repeat-containing protein n=1 Tax=Eleusine coracana subsp. coracana TaxID=191504 RepID=A0AAV5D9L7_ELECO|nr:hypothetical protein PR202_ga24486 [Eleusine coracana subsp. coracana]
MAPPTADHLSALLRRCAAARALAAGLQIHARALVSGLLPHATLEADLVLVYCRCGALRRARQVFDGTPSPSMHAYNVLLAASRPGAALEILAGILASELRPDRYTVPAVLRACAELPDAALGSAMHGFSLRLGLFPNVVGSGALLGMPGEDRAAGWRRQGVRRDAPEGCRRVELLGYRLCACWEGSRSPGVFWEGQIEAANMARDLRAVPTAKRAECLCQGRGADEGEAGPWPDGAVRWSTCMQSAGV